MRLHAAVVVLALAAGPAAAEDDEKTWDLSAAVYGFVAPDSRDYLNPNLTADRGRLHLEARWNYEALDTGSVWGGANFSVGDSWVFDATAMLGGVFGETDGFAPGYRLSLGHAWFEASSEGEYLFDVHDHTGDFFYSWNEVTGTPVDWFRAGLAAQRTRAYETGLSIQRGFVAAFTYRSLDAAAYVFNPWSDETTYVLALRVAY